ncbi:uncharacterized protein LOC116345998 [Contarinia nasturtii]|uniref:uncharacterized protein LOC116345998 n=1 Tax=Contarinia nasturtii TaxID=265458 RepID=UPI0012D3BBCC|nr:uncharacterized protein LOC116345998 [Contarinia nasturtii]
MQKLFGIGGALAHLRPSVTSSLHQCVRGKQTITTNQVIVDKFKAVTILSINRPDKQNALNESILHELAAHLTHFEEDDSASVAIINGIGGNFSIGYDIDELKQKSEHDINSVQSSLVFPFRRKTAKPLLCSISGSCKSIGFEIALMCDVRYAEEKAFFCFNNRHQGIPLLNDGPKQLAKLIGLSKTMEFLLMDRQVNAEEALELGIVREVVADGTSLGSIMKTAVYLSSMPESALQHDLSLLNGSHFDKKQWSSILNDIKSNVSLSEESLKSARVSKLNKMSQWELEEIEHEKNYEERQKTNTHE